MHLVIVFFVQRYETNKAIVASTTYPTTSEYTMKKVLKPVKLNLRTPIFKQNKTWKQVIVFRSFDVRMERDK